MVGRGMIAARTASKLQRGRPSHLNPVYLVLLSLIPFCSCPRRFCLCDSFHFHPAWPTYYLITTSAATFPVPVARQTTTQHNTPLRSPPTQHLNQLARLTKICLAYGNKCFWGHSSPLRAARNWSTSMTQPSALTATERLSRSIRIARTWSSSMISC